MLSSEALNTCVNGLVKLVAAWPTPRLMLVRFTLDLIISVLVIRLRSIPLPSMKDIPWLVARGLAYCMGLVCFWGGLQSCLPVGDVVVTVIALAPLMVALFARALLHEPIPPTWPPQMVLCIVGALLINKPMAPAAECPVTTDLLPVGAAFFWGLMNLVVRKCSHVPPPVVAAFTDIAAIVFACLSAVATTSGDIAAGAALIVPDAFDSRLLLAVLAACAGWCGTQCNIAGIQTVTVAVVASVAGSTSVPFNYTMQVVVFGELPDRLAIIGAALIVVTNVVVTVAKYKTAMRAAVNSKPSAEGLSA